MQFRSSRRKDYIPLFGFISIDCGYRGKDYQDPDTTITYTSDANYIENGEALSINDNSQPMQYRFLRRFTHGKRNCYNVTGLINNWRYLIRASFLHANYDSSFRLPKFELYLGVDFWYTVSFNSFNDLVWAEIISLNKVKSVAICLVNTGLGTPFISTLELRLLPNSMYTVVNGSWSLKTYLRLDIGSLLHTNLRYKADPCDRIWVPFTVKDWTNLNTKASIVNSDDEFQPPVEVMQTAAIPSNPNGSILLGCRPPSWDPESPFYFYFFFAEMRNRRNLSREVNIYINGDLWSKIIRASRFVRWVGTILPERRSQDYQIDIRATETSDLPPILNALELYVANVASHHATDARDVAVLLDMKDKLALKNKSWVGDPCLPQGYPWEALTCNEALNPRIISLDLSASGLQGEIPASIASLNAHESLNLSNNQLTGPIPQSLADLTKLKSLDLSRNNLTGLVPIALIEKRNSGALLLSIFQNPNLLTPNPSEPTQKKKTEKAVVIMAISLSATTILLFAFAFGLIMKRKKIIRTKILSMRKRKGSSKSDGPQALTHSEIVKITNNYEKVIGKGGYGIVFFGVLENGREVAVKILSKESQQGIKEFSAEVKLLMRVHHRYLASLIGFSEEGKDKILVFEYMSKGNLNEILSDNSSNSEVLNWEQRIQIALSATQGLEYLHYGCKPPIVHRDVKTSNILLNEKLEAKVADFGSARFGLTDGDSHITTTVAGTQGYVDPEYQPTSSTRRVMSIALA
ncbi:putative leucine-rich repeat receptor-like serine/threonine-protein kinase At2g19230 isoform X2 [Amborella trichopoda]|uniref:putative leucine-rich repeat receptor-like serine/threonine-protein kinase At2g19230 isoform X2 n=1 Tax=Amborella trichopoda TaxID=13333 RepID=UPI0009BE3F56|nr:putative leucine-rich repeat receptor-like serine/threonine-protein kinase At2g19230 isoform X2 [Amborella trichopoda]|eukprot:XP_020532310.1 putative leucine-rich repeat receptor-like serine/threonine-protein kinase At2g19230 isoform X2 [Amborella trichopoda]